MIRIELTGSERQVLVESLKTSDDPKLRERYRAILMAGSGGCPYRIAKDLHLNRASVVVWIKDYQDQGPEGLKIHSAPGESGHMPEYPDSIKLEPRGCHLNRVDCAYSFLPALFFRHRDIMEIEERMHELRHRPRTGLSRMISRFLRARYCYYHTRKYKVLSLIERIGRAVKNRVGSKRTKFLL